MVLDMGSTNAQNSVLRQELDTLMEYLNHHLQI